MTTAQTDVLQRCRKSVIQPRFTSTREKLSYLYHDKGIDVDLVQNFIHSGDILSLVDTICFILNRPKPNPADLTSHIPSLQPGTQAAEYQVIKILGLNEGFTCCSNDTIYFLDALQYSPDLFHLISIIRSQARWKTEEQFTKAWETSPYHAFKLQTLQQFNSNTTSHLTFPSYHIQSTLASYLFTHTFIKTDGDDFNLWIGMNEDNEINIDFTEAILLPATTSLTHTTLSYRSFDSATYKQRIEDILEFLIKSIFYTCNIDAFDFLIEPKVLCLPFSQTSKNRKLHYQVAKIIISNQLITMGYFRQISYSEAISFLHSKNNTNDDIDDGIDEYKATHSFIHELDSTIPHSLSSIKLSKSTQTSLLEQYISLYKQYKSFFWLVFEKYYADILSPIEIISLFILATIFNDVKLLDVLKTKCGITNPEFYSNVTRLNFVRDYNITAGLDHYIKIRPDMALIYRFLTYNAIKYNIPSIFTFLIKQYNDNNVGQFIHKLQINPSININQSQTLSKHRKKTKSDEHSIFFNEETDFSLSFALKSAQFTTYPYVFEILLTKYPQLLCINPTKPHIGIHWSQLFTNLSTSPLHFDLISNTIQTIISTTSYLQHQLPSPVMIGTTKADISDNDSVVSSEDRDANQITTQNETKDASVLSNPEAKALEKLLNSHPTPLVSPLPLAFPSFLPDSTQDHFSLEFFISILSSIFKKTHEIMKYYAYFTSLRDINTPECMHYFNAKDSIADARPVQFPLSLLHLIIHQNFIPFHIELTQQYKSMDSFSTLLSILYNLILTNFPTHLIHLLSSAQQRAFHTSTTQMINLILPVPNSPIQLPIFRVSYDDNHNRSPTTSPRHQSSHPITQSMQLGSEHMTTDDVFSTVEYILLSNNNEAFQQVFNLLILSIQHFNTDLFQYILTIYKPIFITMMANDVKYGDKINSILIFMLKGPMSGNHHNNDCLNISSLHITDSTLSWIASNDAGISTQNDNAIASSPQNYIISTENYTKIDQLVDSVDHFCEIALQTTKEQGKELYNEKNIAKIKHDVFGTQPLYYVDSALESRTSDTEYQIFDGNRHIALYDHRLFNPLSATNIATIITHPLNTSHDNAPYQLISTPIDTDAVNTILQSIDHITYFETATFITTFNSILSLLQYNLTLPYFYQSPTLFFLLQFYTIFDFTPTTFGMKLGSILPNLINELHYTPNTLVWSIYQSIFPQQPYQLNIANLSTNLYLNTRPSTQQSLNYQIHQQDIITSDLTNIALLTNSSSIFQLYQQYYNAVLEESTFHEENGDKSVPMKKILQDRLQYILAVRSQTILEYNAMYSTEIISNEDMLTHSENEKFITEYVTQYSPKSITSFNSSTLWTFQQYILSSNYHPLKCTNQAINIIHYSIMDGFVEYISRWKAQNPSRLEHYTAIFDHQQEISQISEPMHNPLKSTPISCSAKYMLNSTRIFALISTYLNFSELLFKMSNFLQFTYQSGLADMYSIYLHQGGSLFHDNMCQSVVYKDRIAFLSPMKQNMMKPQSTTNSTSLYYSHPIEYMYCNFYTALLHVKSFSHYLHFILLSCHECNMDDVEQFSSSKTRHLMMQSYFALKFAPLESFQSPRTHTQLVPLQSIRETPTVSPISTPNLTPLTPSTEPTNINPDIDPDYVKNLTAQEQSPVQLGSRPRLRNYKSIKVNSLSSPLISNVPYTDQSITSDINANIHVAITPISSSSSNQSQTVSIDISSQHLQSTHLSFPTTSLGAAVSAKQQPIDSQVSNSLISPQLPVSKPLSSLQDDSLQDKTSFNLHNTNTSNEAEIESESEAEVEDEAEIGISLFALIAPVIMLSAAAFGIYQYWTSTSNSNIKWKNNRKF